MQEALTAREEELQKVILQQPIDEENWLSSAHLAARDAIIADLSCQLEAAKAELSSRVPQAAAEELQCQLRDAEERLRILKQDSERQAASLCAAEARACEAERKLSGKEALRERAARVQAQLEEEKAAHSETSRHLASCQANLAELRGNMQRKEVGHQRGR